MCLSSSGWEWVCRGSHCNLFSQFKTKCYNFFNKKPTLKLSYLFMQLLLSARHILSISEGGGSVAISQARKLRLRDVEQIPKVTQEAQRRGFGMIDPSYWGSLWARLCLLVSVGSGVSTQEGFRGGSCLEPDS